MKKRRLSHVVLMFIATAFAGQFVLGGLPYPSFFSLLHDTLRPVTVYDHGTVRRLWLLGLVNYFSGEQIRTVGDVLAWADIPVTTHQANTLDLCRPLNAGEKIVIAPNPFQRGVASWYGPGFHGQLAAAGEAYNMYALTAAHKTLPLGSMVRVMYPMTGRSVVVRINDRGPYAFGRIIDLSYAAKRKLGMDDVASVYLERIDSSALQVSCK